MSLQPEYREAFESLLQRPRYVYERVADALIFLAVAYDHPTWDEIWMFVGVRRKLLLDQSTLLHENAEDPDDAFNLWKKAMDPFVAVSVDERDDDLVHLQDPALQQFILKEARGVPTQNDRVGMTFTVPRKSAQAQAAVVCLEIARCSFGEFVCRQFHSIHRHEPPLIRYSYDFWFSHLVAGESALEELSVKLVKDFFTEILQDAAFLLGSISLTIRGGLADLGPNKANIHPTSGALLMQSASLKTSKSLKDLSTASFDSAYSAGRQLDAGSTSLSGFQEVCIVKYNQWKRRKYLSRLAHEISGKVLIPESRKLDYENFVDFSLKATQNLYVLALEISASPVIEELLVVQRRTTLDLVAPFLVAGQALESVTLWPAQKALQLEGITPWKINQSDRLYVPLSHTLSKLSGNASALPLENTALQSKTFPVDGEQAVFTTWYFCLNKAVGLKRSASVLFQDSKAHRHLRKAFDYAYALVSIPITLVLNLGILLWSNLERLLSWFWVVFLWSCRLLRLSYTDCSVEPWTFRKRDLGAIFGGLCLYAVRGKVFPTLGQHWSPNPFTQIRTAINTPLGWIAGQNELTWRTYLWYQGGEGLIHALAASGYTVLREKFPSYGGMLHKVWAFQQFLTIERAFCQIVTAVLTVTVPIMTAMQLEAEKPGNASMFFFREAFLRPYRESTFMESIAALIRVLLPQVIIWNATSYGMMANSLNFYASLSMIPFGMMLSTWGILFFFEEVKYYPPVFEDPVDAFVISLIVAVTLLSLYFFREWVLENWQRLLTPWRGFLDAVSIARTISTQEIVDLQNFYELKAKSHKD